MFIGVYDKSYSAAEKSDKKKIINIVQQGSQKIKQFDQLNKRITIFFINFSNKVPL